MERRSNCSRLFSAKVAIVAALIGFSSGAIQGADAPHKARILMLTQSGGFRHGPVTRKEGQLAPAEIAVIQLGKDSGLFTVDCTQDGAADFTKANLQNYDIVFFYTTGTLKGDKGALPMKEEDLDYFIKDWLKQKGHGFIGTHSATDTYGDYEPYWDMIGGTFNGHPWGSGATVNVTVHDTKHPGSRPWGSEFEIKDEIYQYKNWQPEKVHVLMSLNMAKTPLKMPYHVPLSWVKEYGAGRVYYTNLGHNPQTWTNKTFIQALEGGIRWIMRLENGDATPNPEVSKAQDAKSKADWEAWKAAAEQAAKEKAEKEKAEKDKAGKSEK